MLKIIIKYLLWLLIINLAISLGGGLYEARIEIPNWLLTNQNGELEWNAKAAINANTGLRFWAFVTTGPLTLLTLLSLVFVWFTEYKTRRWWLIGILFLLIDRFMTFFYFIPTMINLMSPEINPEDAVKIAARWVMLNNIRHISTILGLISIINSHTNFSNDIE